MLISLIFIFTFYFNFMYKYLYLLIFFTSVFILDKVLIILSGTLEILDFPCNPAEPVSAV